MSADLPNPPTASAEPQKSRFVEDFRRFFVRGLAALLPTMITLWLLIKIWDFLWENIGQYVIWFIGWAWFKFRSSDVVPEYELSRFTYYWKDWTPDWSRRLMGVLLAILVIYIVGLFVGNLIGRTLLRLAEKAIFRIPLIKQIYPSVKQVTDFILSDKKQHFVGSRVVAVEPHANGIWSIGLVTGHGVRAMGDLADKEMVTVFVPSTPTAFAGYVLVVPRERVYELPLTVEQALRLLVSGGVIDPQVDPRRFRPGDPGESPGALEAANSSPVGPAAKRIESGE